MAGWVQRVDLRRKGSGNIGAANTWRVLGMGPAVIVFLLDWSKGFLPTFLAAPLVQPDVQALIGLAAVIGHDYSIFLGLRGGKGVATTAGVIAAIDWRIALIAVGIWLICALISRIPSLSSLIAMASLIPLLVLWQPSYLLLGVVLFGLALIRHQSNIERLSKGQEYGFSTALPSPRKGDP